MPKVKCSTCGGKGFIPSMAEASRLSTKGLPVTMQPMSAPIMRDLIAKRRKCRKCKGTGYIELGFKGL